MSYHIFQKEKVNFCFPQKKKRKQKNQIKITKIVKNVMSIIHFLYDSKPFALLAFQGEDCMHLHPKNHLHIRL